MKKKIFLVLGLFTMGLMSVAFVSTIETSNLSVLIGNLEAIAEGDDDDKKTFQIAEETKSVEIGITTEEGYSWNIEASCWFFKGSKAKNPPKTSSKKTITQKYNCCMKKGDLTKCAPKACAEI